MSAPAASPLAGAFADSAVDGAPADGSGTLVPSGSILGEGAMAANCTSSQGEEGCQDSGDGSSTLTPGMIAAIACGGALCVLLVATWIFCLCCRTRHTQQTKDGQVCARASMLVHFTPPRAPCRFKNKVWYANTDMHTCFRAYRRSGCRWWDPSSALTQRHRTPPWGTPTATYLAIPTAPTAMPTATFYSGIPPVVWGHHCHAPSPCTGRME